jgi:hypothetical protein
MPSSWNTLGQYAPEKLAQKIEDIDHEKLSELRKFYDTRAIVLSFMSIGTIAPVILMIIGSFYSNPNLDFMLGTFTMPKLNDWVYILLLGIFSTYAQIYMTKAYSFAKAGIIGTISSLIILYNLSIKDIFPADGKLSFSSNSNNLKLLIFFIFN